MTLTLDDPRSVDWGSPLLPDWVTEFRPHQLDAVDEIVEGFTNHKVVFLDAPTGAGKTLIAEMARRRMDLPTAYLCSSLTLQDQFLHDFPYAQVLKGRSNYPTMDRPEEFLAKGMRQLTAGHCNKTKLFLPACETCHWKKANTAVPDEDVADESEYTHCDYCHPIQHCPYAVAKNLAVHAHLAVINTTYFLTEANYVGQFGEQHDSGIRSSQHPMVIIDEADVLEAELMRHIEFSLSRRKMVRLGIEEPKLKTKPESWLEWIMIEAQPKMMEALDEVSKVMRRSRQTGNSVPAEVMKEYNELNGYLTKLEDITEHIHEGWVYTGYEDPESRYASVTFKPVTVERQAPKTLWRHGDKFLLMSATIISAQQMAEDLGLEDHEWTEVIVGSAFDPEKRPIYVMPRAVMTKKTEDDAWPKMATAIESILDAHPNDPILVHTVSYRFTEYLEYRVMHVPSWGGRVVSDLNSRERAEALVKFRQLDNAVLLAPSFERGVDLPDEECRVVVVAKIPFPYLGDKQISARLYGSKRGEQWYTVTTIRTLVQMTGRAMRHADDFCEIYVLDSMFLSRIWKRSRMLIPQWWRDAVKWIP